MPASISFVDQLSRRMRALAQRFREKHPLQESPWRAGHYLIPIFSRGYPAHKTLIWYHNKGCVWARKAGCTMCNFGEREDVPLDDGVVDDFVSEISRLDPGTKFLHLGPGGSVLQEKELSTRLRLRLIDALGSLPFLEGIGLETRAETVRLERLRLLCSAMPSHVTELAFGFGLESADDLILRVAVNKGEHVRDLEAAINHIHLVNREFPGLRVVVDCYVLLKPPFLTESEAIQDATTSIDWAYDRGVDTVTLFVNTVKENTLCWWLNRQKHYEPPLRYEPPFLLSAIDVLAGLMPERRARTGILGFTSGKPYVGAPRSCDLCWHVLHGLISAHNYTRHESLINVAREIRCDCRESWIRELSLPRDDSKPERFAAYISRIERDLV
jgi:radical SAM enzyme (TIGR01210 family)